MLVSYPTVEKTESCAVLCGCELLWSDRERVEVIEFTFICFLLLRSLFVLHGQLCLFRGSPTAVDYRAIYGDESSEMVIR